MWASVLLLNLTRLHGQLLCWGKSNSYKNCFIWVRGVGRQTAIFMNWAVLTVVYMYYHIENLELANLVNLSMVVHYIHAIFCQNFKILLETNVRMGAIK